VLLTSISCWQIFAAEVKLDLQEPQSIRQIASGHYLIDFGKVAFGNVQLESPEICQPTITIHWGENLQLGRIDRQPPGSVRYYRQTISLTEGTPHIVAPTANERNTEQNNPKHPPAVLTNAAWNTLLPFRWIEIEGWQGDLKQNNIVRRAAYVASWNDTDATFTCSDPLLNRVWDLCKDSVKATSFAGVYVDGDRERISYEVDSYIGQLSHYATSNDIQMARDTFDRLIQYPTWPTECAPAMVLMAYKDWMHTGDRDRLQAVYSHLPAKSLLPLAREDGLIPRQGTDLVDWPPGERDGFIVGESNIVVNAFHLAAIKRLIVLADAMGYTSDSASYRKHYQKSYQAFQTAFYNRQTGLYRDSIGTDHSSLHANLFPLAFQLIPEDRRVTVVEWLQSQPMRCSIYAAQFLLEGLFENDATSSACALILAENDRSWRHMLEQGTTVTWEAWDAKYKGNLDWNHIWGTAPANLFPKYILGVRPVSPGWNQVLVRPSPGSLESASGVIPTPRGPIQIAWSREANWELKLSLPPGVTAQLELPASDPTAVVTLDDEVITPVLENNRWRINSSVQGKVTVTIE
jgi:hypothetical protein